MSWTGDRTSGNRIRCMPDRARRSDYGRSSILLPPPLAARSHEDDTHRLQHIFITGLDEIALCPEQKTDEAALTNLLLQRRQTSIGEMPRHLGYRRVITYTLASEPGTSLKAAGWREVGQVCGRSWDRRARPRAPRALHDKRRWESPPSALPPSSQPGGPGG